MDLLFNQTTLTLAKDQAIAPLTINEFVNRFKYKIDAKTLNILWPALDSEEFINIDKDVLKLMGVSKTAYVAILKKKASDDYASKDQLMVKQGVFKDTLGALPNKSFIDTYAKLSKIAIDYITYTNQITNHNNELKLKRIQHDIDSYQRLQANNKQLQFQLNTNSAEMNEYVYILTSKRYYERHMFKIGMTINLKSRLVGYNTGIAIEGDKLFYLATIKCFDSRGLEKNLHTALAAFHCTKEWFQIPQKALFDIVALVIEQQSALCKTINQQIMTLTTNEAKDEHGMISVDESKYAISMEEFIKLNGPEAMVVAKPKEQLICPSCDKVYKMKSAYEKHVIACATSSSEDISSEDIGSEEVSIDSDVCIDGPIIESDELDSEVMKPISRKRYECRQCNCFFVSHRLFEKHMDEHAKCQVIKRGFLGFKCGRCDHAFVSKRNANSHVKTCMK